MSCCKKTAFIFRKVTFTGRSRRCGHNCKTNSRPYSSHQKTSIANRPVILVDDVLRDTDELTASIQTVKKQKPANIVIAAAVVTSRAVHLLAEEEFRLFTC